MIRLAERGDIDALAQLWTRAFPGSRTARDRARHLEMGGVFGGLETAWLATDGERVTGAFRAYALTQHMHGRAYRTMGLAAVAVEETQRRRGLGRQLCAHAVRIARERGDVLSVLYPFRPAYYHALGWGMVGELHAFRFRPESLRTVRAGTVRAAGAADSSGLAACYAAVAQETNGLITRTPRAWRSHLQAHGVHAYVTGDQRVSGYLLVQYGRGVVPDRRVLYVRELVAEDRASYETLLGWIAAQRDSWRVVQYEAAPDEEFGHRLDDPRPPGYRSMRALWSVSARVIRGPMLRLLDVPEALRRRVHWGAAAPVRFTLRVHDPLVPENGGPFLVDYDGRRAQVTRGEGGRPTLTAGAAALAQIFAGELTVRAALNVSAVECDGDAAALDSLFRTDRCFRLLDEF